MAPRSRRPARRRARPAFARGVVHGLDALDDEPVAVPEDEQLAGAGHGLAECLRPESRRWAFQPIIAAKCSLYCGSHRFQTAYASPHGSIMRLERNPEKPLCNGNLGDFSA